MRKELGRLIRKRREQKNLKEKELARKLGVSIFYVQHLQNECKAAVFSDGLMAKVIRILQLPPRKTLDLAAAHNRRVRRYRNRLAS